MVEKAMKAEPDNAAYLDSMGWVLFRLGEFAAAKEHLLKAAEKLESEDSTIYEHLGDIHEALGEHEDAVKVWIKALKLEAEKQFGDEKLLERLRKKVPVSDQPVTEPKATPAGS